jgi:hypothetical protein
MVENQGDERSNSHMKIAAFVLALGVIALAIGLMRRRRTEPSRAAADGGAGGGAEFSYASDTGHCSTDGGSDGGCDGAGGGDGGGGGGGD